MVGAEVTAARRPIIFLLGPTAVGKTDLAIALAAALPLSIISVDSVMVYRGLDIGSGKPNAAILKSAPHRLVDIRDPDECYSAAAFCRDALAAIAEIHSEGRAPLLVGGTRLYFHALEHGLSALPAADAPLRARLNTEAAQLGWPALHARLRALDPLSAARIHRHDAQRIQRALEICALSGQSPSALRAQQRERQRLPYPIISFVLQLPTREQLHQRIAQRFRRMLDDGLLDELARLRQRYRLHPQLPSMRAVGYRQALQVLERQLAAADLPEKGIAATRQLARRQLTWLRSRANDIAVDASQPDALNTIQCMLQQRIAALDSEAPHHGSRLANAGPAEVVYNG